MSTCVKPLTAKALDSIRQTGYLNVWEGSVRASKTVASELAWIHYIVNSPDQVFIMSGRTQASLYRNVIGGDFGLLAMLGSLATFREEREGSRVLIVRGTRHGTPFEKTCYCFGASDASSHAALRGLTAGGWYADEVNMQAKSFVEEAFRRTIVSTDRKHFWTLNPGNPLEYIYTDYLDRYQEQQLPGFHLWHFTLDDNLALTEARKAELRAQYSGLFYRRYILGERCLAEGIIYDMLTEENFYDDTTRPQGLPYLATRYISIDYGTTNPCVFLDIYDDGTTIWIDREYYFDSHKAQRQKDDSEYADDFEAFIGDQPDHPPAAVVVDPSAASFILTLKHRGYLVKPAVNDVLYGIRILSTLFKHRTVKIHTTQCPNTCAELQVYAWDDKAVVHTGKEAPLKIKDHSADSIRYWCATILPKWRLEMGAETTTVVAGPRAIVQQFRAR